MKKQQSTGGHALTPLLKMLLTPAAHLVPADATAASKTAPLMQALLSAGQNGGAGAGAAGGGIAQQLLAAISGLGTGGEDQQGPGAGGDLQQVLAAATGAVSPARTTRPPTYKMQTRFG